MNIYHIAGKFGDLKLRQFASKLPKYNIDGLLEATPWQSLPTFLTVVKNTAILAFLVSCAHDGIRPFAIIIDSYNIICSFILNRQFANFKSLSIFLAIRCIYWEKLLLKLRILF